MGAAARVETIRRIELVQYRHTSTIIRKPASNMLDDGTGQACQRGPATRHSITSPPRFPWHLARGLRLVPQSRASVFVNGAPLRRDCELAGPCGRVSGGQLAVARPRWQGNRRLPPAANDASQQGGGEICLIPADSDSPVPGRAVAPAMLSMTKTTDGIPPPPACPPAESTRRMGSPPDRVTSHSSAPAMRGVASPTPLWQGFLPFPCAGSAGVRAASSWRPRRPGWPGSSVG